MDATKESVMRDKVTVRTLRAVASLLPMALLAPLAVGCSNGGTGGLPDDIKTIVFIQRTPRDSQGNVFDYTSYAGGGRLVKLSPPHAGETPQVLFPTEAACAGLVDPSAADTAGEIQKCMTGADIM